MSDTEKASTVLMILQSTVECTVECQCDGWWRGRPISHEFATNTGYYGNMSWSYLHQYVYQF